MGSAEFDELIYHFLRVRFSSRQDKSALQKGPDYSGKDRIQLMPRGNVGVLYVQAGIQRQKKVFYPDKSPSQGVVSGSEQETL